MKLVTTTAHMHLNGTTPDMSIPTLHLDTTLRFAWAEVDPQAVYVHMELPEILADRMAVTQTPTWVIAAEQFTNVLHGGEVPEDVLSIARAFITWVSIEGETEKSLEFRGLFDDPGYLARVSESARFVGEMTGASEEDIRKAEQDVTWEFRGLLYDAEPLKELLSHLVVNLPSRETVSDDLDAELAALLSEQPKPDDTQGDTTE